MSVATPVLERNADTKEREHKREYRDTFMTADERHNSQISENYAKLINPDSKLGDIIAAKRVAEVPAPVESLIPVRQAVAQKPYLVENARVDADIFRADNPVNRKLIESAGIGEIYSQYEEEENEDLRPTMTTIQYKSVGSVEYKEGIKKAKASGKIETKPAQTKKLSLSKKDKIIIAVALAVIIALFVLIIVNSAVISSLSSDVNSLQTTLTQAETTYTEVLAEKTQYLDNIEQIVSDFATDNGMILG